MEQKYRIRNTVAMPVKSRRTFLSRASQFAATGAFAGWIPAFRIDSVDAAIQYRQPPDFPRHIPLYQQAYRNWAQDIVLDPAWVCAPATPADVVSICNWAYAQGYKVRPRGAMHNWSPLTIASNSANPDVVLLDTTKHLSALFIDETLIPKRVTAQTGIRMESLLTALENKGLGVIACPAPGDVTLGGALAIGSHGTGVPKAGEARPVGASYGTLSNLVLSLTVVAWDEASQEYALRTFQRSDPECAAWLTHIGRTFITEVTLQVCANQRLRCQSWFDKSASELFAPAGSRGQTVERFLDSAGRFEAIWFPFTPKPWIKVWSVAPRLPLGSRWVTRPYNYPFTDRIPGGMATTEAVARSIRENPSSTPSFGLTQYNLVAAGIVLNAAYDLWGWSKNLLLYVRPSTLRVTANGYAVITERSQVQRVVNEFYIMYESKLEEYRAVDKYPINGPVEIRITGLDQVTDVDAVNDVRSPQLSALRPRLDHPEWDVAVWFDILTIPGTKYANQFFREVEHWMYTNFVDYCAVRVEWSKGWGYTDDAPWTDEAVLSSTVPDSLRHGQSTASDWDTAHQTFNLYDPHRIFSSPLLDSLLP